MKNLIAEKPTDDLHGRLAYTVSFVENADIKDKIILDIGCGYGWFELNVLSRGVKAVVASELTKSDLETIRKNIVNPKIKYSEANAIDLPFDNETFDTVVCWEVIEHIPKDTEKKMFSEIRRVLKPNGKFYLSTPYNSWPSRIFDPAWWLIGHRHYTEEQLLKFGKKEEFELKKIDIKGRWWEVFGILNMYFSKWVLKRKPILEKIFIENIEKEYHNEDGFVDIFVKFQRI